MKTTAKVQIDLEPGGTRRIKIIATTVEGRDLAMQRLTACLPQLELLERAIQSAAVPTAAAQVETK